MPTILFTAGAKGGPGKSTAARFLITYVRHHGADPLLLDLDDENRTLSRFFPEALQVEIKKKSSHDILVERALKGDSLIIADLKAGTGRDVLDWWLDVPFDELQSPRVQFVCVASITSSPDSVQSFFNWVTALQDRVTYIVFRNLKDGDYLPDYDKSDEALAFRERFAPHHVVLPRLDEEYVTELERLDLTIAEVLEASNGKSSRGRDIGPLLCRLMVRARLRRFQQAIYDQLDAVHELLSSHEQTTGQRTMNAPEAQQAFFKDLVAELLHRHRAEFFRDLHEGGISPTDVELARLQSGNRSWGTDLAPQRPSQQAAKPRRKRPMHVAGGFLSHSSTLRR